MSDIDVGDIAFNERNHLEITDLRDQRMGDDHHIFKPSTVSQEDRRNVIIGSG